ncbi:MAG: copper amine oxidase N-terminal domain-containing protein [Clostridia bacterium]|nr:copper amine oxidase N-terminal domain-containing protein [Clostridia bacterium]
MRKLLATLFIIIFLINSLVVPAIAQSPGVSVTVDGKAVAFPDAKPFIDENNRTLIPIAFVSMALGGTVEWDGKLKEVYITKGDTKVKIRINDRNILVNNHIKSMDTKAIIKNSRTFVPIYFVADALGAKVSWNGTTRTVIITTGTGKEPTPPIIWNKFTKGQVLAYPKAKELMEIEGFSGVMSSSAQNVIELNYSQYNSGNNGAFDMTNSVTITHDGKAIGSTITTIKVYRCNTEGLRRYKRILDIVVPDIADAVYKITEPKMGGKYKGYDSEYYKDYELFYKSLSPSVWKAEETGLFIVISYK